MSPAAVTCCCHLAAAIAVTIAVRSSVDLTLSVQNHPGPLAASCTGFSVEGVVLFCTRPPHACWLRRRLLLLLQGTCYCHQLAAQQPGGKETWCGFIFLQVRAIPVAAAHAGQPLAASHQQLQMPRAASCYPAPVELSWDDDLIVISNNSHSKEQPVAVSCCS
jgi:hypothetical protein